MRIEPRSIKSEMFLNVMQTTAMTAFSHMAENLLFDHRISVNSYMTMRSRKRSFRRC